MDKLIKKIFFVVVISITLVGSYILHVNAEASWTTTSFTQRDLGYGVTLDRYTGTSKSSFNSTTQLDGRNQVIYTANISKNSSARVVQWTKNAVISDNYWGSHDLRRIAEDYEKKHPGEKVLVATNNWLSSPKSSNRGELDSVQVCDGLNYRVSDKQGLPGATIFNHDYIPRNGFLGFDASGKNAYFTDDWNNGENYTDKLILSYYNGVGQERTMLNLQIDKINEEPADGEIAIYFQNFNGGIQTFANAKIYKMDGITLRYDTDFATEFVTRDAFAMGTFNSIVDQLDVNYQTAGYNCYHIVSKNEEFNNLDLTDKTLVAQYELLGEFANVVGATTYYEHIIRDGECYPGSFGHWNEINCEVHPRTVFVIKEDGTFALSVIDGRQKDMTGMDYEDMANFYKTNYNGYNVFNYDGGGSSAMAVANQNGTFDIVNSPSDGSVRSVDNATLIVVDKDPFEVTQNTRDQDSLTLEFNNIDTSVTKIIATLNGETKEVVDGKVTFENLESDSEHNVSMKYYIGDEEHISLVYTAKTCKLFATLEEFYLLDATQNSISIRLVVSDPAESFYQGYVEINGKKKYFSEIASDITIEGLKYETEYDCKVMIYSTTGTLNDHGIEYTYPVSTTEAKYAEDIFIFAEKTEITVGEEIKLTITTDPEGITKRFYFESSDELIATVSSLGKIKALSPGTVTIYVSTKEGLTREIIFKVNAPVEPVKLNAPVITLNNNIIYWSEIENAVGYNIYINEKIVKKNYQELSYQLELKEIGTYNIYIVALGNKEDNLDSDISNSVTYIIEPTKLSTPVITLNENIISWEKIDNASGYAIYDQDTLIVEKQTTTSYDLSDLTVGTHNIKIVALSDKDNYLNSDESNIIEYIVEEVTITPEPDPTPTPTPEPVEKGCQSCKKKSLLIGTTLISLLSIVMIILRKKR